MPIVIVLEAMSFYKKDALREVAHYRWTIWEHVIKLLMVDINSPRNHWLKELRTFSANVMSTTIPLKGRGKKHLDYEDYLHILWDVDQMNYIWNHLNVAIKGGYLKKKDVHISNEEIFKKLESFFKDYCKLLVESDFDKISDFLKKNLKLINKPR